MSLVYLSLGSNLGDKTSHLNSAIEKLNQLAGTVVRRSSFYVTKPWGFESKNDFLNGVVLLKTSLSPLALLEKIQQIEQMMGRVSKTSHQKYVDRTIDIDILLYDNLVMEHPSLTLPHPLMTSRDFVLIPLFEIAPNITDPRTGMKMKNFLSTKSSI
ncbi:MAG: 2-amino-4-hydroxy-6-hydroxymethyldihydropteridine diphosphokinase [Paludibacteraceae bacterium]|nr:2-amino-4-hydroxy-6-hydroxymethyldihydropteridine diphosphokinase [Paludibacteraceae bacterium]